jgi:hypothetical protein
MSIQNKHLTAYILNQTISVIKIDHKIIEKYGYSLSNEK